MSFCSFDPDRKPRGLKSLYEKRNGIAVWRERKADKRDDGGRLFDTPTLLFFSGIEGVAPVSFLVTVIPSRD
jgi:hypothetical protein